MSLQANNKPGQGGSIMFFLIRNTNHHHYRAMVIVWASEQRARVNWNANQFVLMDSPWSDSCSAPICSRCISAHNRIGSAEYEYEFHSSSHPLLHPKTSWPTKAWRMASFWLTMQWNHVPKTVCNRTHQFTFMLPNPWQPRFYLDSNTRAKSIFLIITMAMTMIVQQTFQFKLWPTGLHEHRHRHQTHGFPQLVWALHTHTANQTTVLCTDQH